MCGSVLESARQRGTLDLGSCVCSSAELSQHVFVCATCSKSYLLQEAL